MEKVDIAKFVILFAEGGVYCDMDMELLQSLDTLVEGCSLAAAAIYIAPGGYQFVINNAFIAATPQHPAVAEMLRHIIDVRWRLGDCVAATRINRGAGPIAWTINLMHYCQRQLGIGEDLSALDLDETEQRFGLRILRPGTVDLLGTPELHSCYVWVPTPPRRHILHHAEGTWRGCCITFASTTILSTIACCAHYLVWRLGGRREGRSNSTHGGFSPDFHSRLAWTQCCVSLAEKPLRYVG